MDEKTDTIAVAVSFQFNEQDGELDVYKCCRSLVVMIPSLILMNQLIIFSYDTITCIILIHRCPMECPAILHSVCNK